MPSIASSSAAIGAMPCALRVSHVHRLGEELDRLPLVGPDRQLVGGFEAIEQREELLDGQVVQLLGDAVGRLVGRDRVRSCQPPVA